MLPGARLGREFGAAQGWIIKPLLCMMHTPSCMPIYTQICPGAMGTACFRMVDPDTLIVHHYRYLPRCTYMNDSLNTNDTLWTGTLEEWWWPNFKEIRAQWAQRGSGDRQADHNREHGGQDGLGSATTAWTVWCPWSDFLSRISVSHKPSEWPRTRCSCVLCLFLLPR